MQMNVILLDPQSILTDQQTVHVRERLQFTLARFDSSIHFAVMSVSREELDRYCCAIQVTLPDSTEIVAARSCQSGGRAVNMAVGAIENKVAFRVNWQSRFHLDRFATYMTVIGKSLKMWFGIARQSPIRKRLSLVPEHGVRKDPGTGESPVAKPHSQDTKSNVSDRSKNETLPWKSL